MALTFDFGLSTKIHLGFNLRASVSFPATESSNSHLSLQHLALALVSFYKSGLRKDWISHLIKRDYIACCFLLYIHNEKILKQILVHSLPKNINKCIKITTFKKL